MAYGFGLQKAGNRRSVGPSPEHPPGPSANRILYEGLTYKGPGCGVVATESGMNFSQELSPFLFGDAPLEHSSCTFLIRLSLMDF